MKYRLNDIDNKIRDSSFALIETILMTMESDIADNTTIEQLFLPLLKETNPKLVESTLTLLSHLFRNAKKLNTVLVAFMVYC